MNAGVAGPICAFGASVTWAVGSAVYSKLTEKYSAFAVNFSRALVALPLFVAAVFISAAYMEGSFSEGLTRFQSITMSHLGWFTLSMIASYGLGDALFLWSTRSLGIPGALAIASSYPLWTVVAGYFFSHEVISVVQCFGLSLSVIGIILVILSGRKKGQPLLKSASFAGVLFAFGTSFAWAINSFAVSQGGKGIDSTVGNALRMFLALGLCGGLAKVASPLKTRIALPFSELKRFYFVFVLESFLGSFLFLYGLSHSPLALGATLSSLAPVISVMVTLATGLEKFSIMRTSGVLLTFVGVALILT